MQTLRLEPKPTESFFFFFFRFNTSQDGLYNQYSLRNDVLCTSEVGIFHLQN